MIARARCAIFPPSCEVHSPSPYALACLTSSSPKRLLSEFPDRLVVLRLLAAVSRSYRDRKRVLVSRLGSG